MKPRRGWAIAGMIVGGLLSLSPLIGLLGTVIGMMGAFKTLLGAGISDPKALSASIGTTLYSTAAGIILFPVGMALLALSIVYFVRSRAEIPPPIPPESAREATRSQISTARIIE